MGRRATTVVVVAEAGPDEEKSTNTFLAYMPFIYNTKALAPDTKLVLQWKVEEKERKAKRGRTWVGDLAANEKRRQRAAASSGA